MAVGPTDHRTTSVCPHVHALRTGSSIGLKNVGRVFFAGEEERRKEGSVLRRGGGREGIWERGVLVWFDYDDNVYTHQSDMLATKYRAARFVCTLSGCLVRVLVGVKNRRQSTAVGIQSDETKVPSLFFTLLESICPDWFSTRECLLGRSPRDPCYRTVVELNADR